MPYYPNSGGSFYGGASGPASTYLGVSGYGSTMRSGPKRTFQSNLLVGPVDKPWKDAKDPWTRVAWWITVVLWFAGIAGAAVLSFFAYRDTPSVGKVCLSFNEEFTGAAWISLIPCAVSGLTKVRADPNLGQWTKEVGVGGYGTGGFEWTTASDKNLKVSGGKLYIVPTLTRDSEGISQDLILSGTSKEIDGCTKDTDSTAYFKDKPLGSAAGLRQHDACNIVSDLTAKRAVNPVQSGRLSSKAATGGNILYGRVEVKAKLPTGDWLYPQIMMLPKDAEYGSWPLSGEIDLMLARGNDANYPKGGNDFITGGLQWGPGVGFNAFDKTRGWWQERRTTFNQAFHTFTLEWTPDFMWIFVDRRVNRVIDLRFKKQTFFERGKFPLTFQNGTDTVLLRNPWETNGKQNLVAPFDKEFYMILTVGAGGTNGWFPDNAGDKPWFDRSNAAMFDFANATDTWHKTWPTKDEDRAMVVEYVKFSKTC
ncbi:concanavalin A-like lectin/glucanase [Auriculariales sp. MPI-PUGE-AT-0066]|nr:concanavalin A-like lectin/glucanase [Auriculariales sp. MPI-PUGE-AT-0066]